MRRRTYGHQAAIFRGRDTCKLCINVSGRPAANIYPAVLVKTASEKEVAFGTFFLPSICYFGKLSGKYFARDGEMCDIASRQNRQENSKVKDFFEFLRLRLQASSALSGVFSSGYQTSSEQYNVCVWGLDALVNPTRTMPPVHRQNELAGSKVYCPMERRYSACFFLSGILFEYMLISFLVLDLRLVSIRVSRQEFHFRRWSNKQRTLRVSIATGD